MKETAAKIASLQLSMVRALERFNAQMGRTTRAHLGEYPEIAGEFHEVLKELIAWLDRLDPPPAEDVQEPPRIALGRELSADLEAAWSGVALVVATRKKPEEPAPVEMVSATFGVLARALCDVHARVSVLEAAFPLLPPAMSGDHQRVDPRR